MSVESGALDLIRRWVELDDSWRASLPPEGIDRKASKEAMFKVERIMEERRNVEYEMRGYLKGALESESAHRIGQR